MPRTIRTDEELAYVLPQLSAADQIAIDTEFHPERAFYPRLMLIQLLPRGGEVLLVDPLSGLNLSPLGPALSAARLVLHGGITDLQILSRVCGLRPNRVFDTQIAAGCVGLGYPTRLGEVLRLTTGHDLPKHETLSDWSTRPLLAEQLEYAADDVRWLHLAVDELEARMSQRGTTEIAAGFLDELLTAGLGPEDDQSAWRTLGAAGVLDPAERAVAQAIAAWREGVARDRDQPRQNVLSDGAIIDLARRHPHGLDGLRANRRLAPPLIRRDGEALLAAISRGRAAPPPPPMYPHSRTWTELVRVAARIAERQTGVAAEITLAGDTLHRLATGADIAPWRRAALGAWFSAFMAGEAHVTIRDAGVT